MIREWMSSKTCSACRAHEVGFFGRTAVCPGCAAERNRDSAAAANMLHVFWLLVKTGERPAGLLALPKHIKKTAA
jgi:transposase